MIDARLSQSLNAYLSISVTDVGIVMVVRPSICSNARSPILVTDEGIETLVIPVAVPVAENLMTLLTPSLTSSSVISVQLDGIWT